MLKKILRSNSSLFLKLALSIIGVSCNSIIINNLPAQAANLITNGGFESGVNLNNSYLTLYTGSTEITGWTVTGSIDYISGWQTSEGNRAIDLNGVFPGGIQQTFNTTPGQTYLVNFDLAGYPAEVPIKSMIVQAAGQSQIFTFDITGKNTLNMGWQSQSWQFTANAAITTLSFISNVESYAGAALDNISVTAIAAQSVAEPLINPMAFIGAVAMLEFFSRKQSN